MGEHTVMIKNNKEKGQKHDNKHVRPLWETLGRLPFQHIQILNIKWYMISEMEESGNAGGGRMWFGDVAVEYILYGTKIMI